MARSYERLLGALHQARMGLFGGDAASRRARRKQRAKFSNALRFEQLEPRVVMSAAGLVPLGAQPTGPLTGKIVYTSGGHGWEWNTALNPDRYGTDRPEYGPEIIEDFGNQEQMSYYVDYLFRAGATVVPMRPVGRQTNERVVDNDSVGVTFTGAWSDSISTRYYDEDYGAVADAVPYRYANTAAGAETATATYTPSIPQEGFYPVYTWVLHGTDRTSQLYTVNHSGGSTEVRVDHSRVGNGWVYLGTYHFAAGSSATQGSVEISNQGTAGKVVIADAIRFGNGLGDSTVSGGPPSGLPREDENSWHWISRSIGIGTSLATAIGSGVSNVSAPSNFAEYMNAGSSPVGSNASSVYVSFHSNGTTGVPETALARGAIGLVDSDQFTPHQQDLALFLGRQINLDMQALNGTFEHNWSGRTTHWDDGGFGEIDLGSNAEMDATIIEVGFHDNTPDSQLMRDPRVRDQLARSTYEGTLEYFDVWGGLTSPAAVASVPVNVRATSAASGGVTISWNAGPAGVHGGAATGFRIYASTNGYGFDGGTFVAGGGTNTVTLNGYDPSLTYYFKVVAVNAGGESKGSEVMAVVPTAGAQRVLIVNGFDRLERGQNFRYPYAYTGDGLVDRTWSRYNNSYDYAVQMATAIHAGAPDVSISTTSNEAVISGAVNLNNYDAVMWILGEESTSTDTFNATEQTKTAAYLAQGGKLFVSGSEIGFDLEAQGGGASFYSNTLKADYLADDAASYSVNAAAGSIFTGLNFSFSNGNAFSSLTSQTYNVDTPDRINPVGGATAALTYASGVGAAGIQHTDAGSGSQLVMLAFPFETITTAANRAAVMERVVQYFQLTELPSEIEVILDNDDGAGVYSETGVWQASGLVGYNGGTIRAANVGSEATAQWQFTAPFAGQAEVFVQYPSTHSRATNAVFQIDTGNGVETASVNQTINGLTWVSLGTHFFEAGQRTITLNALLSSGGTAVNADAVRIVLTAGTAPNGDFDGDSHVDGYDFLAWQRGLGATDATPEQGDANGDGNVDAADLAIWQEQFGAVTPPPAAAAMSGAMAGQGNSGDLTSLAQFELALRQSGAAAKPAAIHDDSQFEVLGVAAASEQVGSEVPTSSAAVVTTPLAPTADAKSQETAELADQAIGRLSDWSWRDAF
jgi:hypothetical protein